MFTGIVETIGTVVSASASSAGRQIVVDLGPVAEGVRLGDSIAISGCCQTVAELGGASAAFDAVPETLRLTTLGNLRRGDRVNLERSLRADGRLGGHFVTGHVDGVAKLIHRAEEGAERLWTFEGEASLAAQMIAKGSVAIAGVSLTLVDVAEHTFSVALIPTTLRETTLGDLAVGEKVNIETDVIGKYVLRYLSATSGQGRRGGLSMDSLRDAGFLE